MSSNEWPNEWVLYKEHLSGNQPYTLVYKGISYTFQFHGPVTGSDNWLEVTREDGVAKKFGWGHGTAEVWRAFSHMDKGWDGPQIPRYREYVEKAEARYQEYDEKGEGRD
jgi:hypothetical protein